MRNLIYVIILLVSVGISSCNSDMESSTLGLVGTSDDMIYEADIQNQQLSSDLEQSNNGTEIEKPSSRKIIKEGDIRFETSKPEVFTTALKEKVKVYNGYVSNETTRDYYDMIEYNVTVRVPAQNFDTLVNWISNREGKIESKNIRVMDVTDTFIDLETRIKTKKELEERYKELLKQAKTVKEVLEIEQQIGILRADIESFEGRFKYLGDRINYSTLSLVYYERIKSSNRNEPSFWSNIVDGFKTGWEFLLVLLIGIVNIWPVWFIIGIPILLIYRKKKRKRNSK